MIDLRMRTKISAGELSEKVGKILTPEDYNAVLTGPARVRKPDGTPLCVYVPGALRGEMTAHYAALSSIRMTTDNRVLASGSELIVRPNTRRTRAKAVTSGILGAFDGTVADRTCRLTAFTVQHREMWDGIRPLFERMGSVFAELVPDRHAAQVAYAARTHADWLIPGTPYTTITVNNTYPTGVHTDKGDLDEGFSCIAVGRAGDYTGGALVFPEYRLGVEMQHGDLLLMDAHEWHGNTWLLCSACGAQLDKPGHTCAAHRGEPQRIPERVSVVAYYRTRMTECASETEENERRVALIERRNQQALAKERS